MFPLISRLVRGLLRAIWKRGAILTVIAFVFLIVGLAALSYSRLGPNPSFEQKTKLLEVTIAGLGLLSVVLLILQLRQSAVYNRTLCYHQFFGELPSQGKGQILARRLESLELPTPTVFKPLTEDDALRLWSSRGATGNEEFGHRLIRAVLDDFEEMCAAINVGLLSDDYVREIEGIRTINVYFGYEQCILLAQREHTRQAEELGARGTGGVSAIRTKAYFELRKVAQRWKTCRAREQRKKLAMEARIERFKKWLERPDTDGVKEQ